MPKDLNNLDADTDELQVTLQYYDGDVCSTFKGFTRPARPDILTYSSVALTVGCTDCDGIVALNIDGLKLTMGADDARKLAAWLIEEAKEQTYIEDDLEDEDDDFGEGGRWTQKGDDEEGWDDSDADY